MTEDEGWDVRTMTKEEVEQIPAGPQPEGSDLSPIDPMKLIALLNRLIANYQAEMAHEGQTGAVVAISDLKYCILNKLYDLEAETA